MRVSLLRAAPLEAALGLLRKRLVAREANPLRRGWFPRPANTMARDGNGDPQPVGTSPRMGCRRPLAHRVDRKPRRGALARRLSRHARVRRCLRVAAGALLPRLGEHDIDARGWHRRRVGRARSAPGPCWEPRRSNGRDEGVALARRGVPPVDEEVRCGVHRDRRGCCGNPCLVASQPRHARSVRRPDTKHSRRVRTVRDGRAVDRRERGRERPDGRSGSFHGGHRRPRRRVARHGRLDSVHALSRRGAPRVPDRMGSATTRFSSCRSRSDHRGSQGCGSSRT